MSLKSVLIADDDPALVKALAIRCQKLGLNVRSASDGLDAWSSLRASPPDLLILDINMPGADGLSIREKLLKDTSVAPLPVIFLTGRTDDETLRRCKELGAFHVAKGADAWDHLKPILTELLQIEAPPEAPPTSSVRPSKSVSSGAKRPRVLVIDDDADLCKAIRIRLEAYGVQVLCAYSGMQGYWMVVKEKPDVVICDYVMPDAYGNQVLRRMKMDGVSHNIPLIFLTGMTVGGGKDYGLEREMMSVGATAYLNKPLDFDDLLRALRMHIVIPKDPCAASA